MFTEGSVRTSTVALDAHRIEQVIYQCQPCATLAEWID
jgi:hypothetical protein